MSETSGDKTLLRNFATTISIVISLAVLTIASTSGIGLLILHASVQDYADYWYGRANQPGDFVYVALGDSAAQGIGASQPEKSYVSLLADRIHQATGRQVRVINLSKTGATLQDALRQQIPQLANIEPDLVTAEIGANDMKHYNPGQFRDDYERFIQSLPPGRSVVSDMPYFGGRPNLNRNAVDASSTIHQLGAAYNVPIAELYDTLRVSQSPLIYASDLFHPNNRGYHLWGQAFWATTAPQLVQKLDSQTF
jgi:acyl-CoA thioesterase I